jgi:lysophospholipase L1-like esterase
MTLNVEQPSSTIATSWINDGRSEAQCKPRPKQARMRPRTRRRWSAPVAVAALLFASCDGSSDEATTETTPTTITANGEVAGTSTLQIEEGPLVYVPMGNSLTFTPSPNHFIARYTAMLQEDFGVDVELRPHTVGGQRTDDFLAQLRTNDSLREDLGDADVVTLLIPNDEWAEPFQIAGGLGGRDPSECGGDDNQQCLRDVIDSYKQYVDQVFDELTAIADPAVTLIRVQDFYHFGTNEMTPEAFDITYPYWREGQEYVEQVAGQYGLAVAQVFDDFMGTDGLYIDLVANGLVDPDGIHPTADGAERMATLMHDLGYNLTADDDDAVSSGDVAAAIAVVTAHNEAQNAGDGELMRATLTDDAAWLDDGDVTGTMEEYVRVVEGYGPVEQTFTGEPTVVRDPTGSGDLQVTVPMSFDSGPQGRFWNGTSVYTLRKIDGEWKIAQIDRQSSE